MIGYAKRQTGSIYDQPTRAELWMAEDSAYEDGEKSGWAKGFVAGVCFAGVLALLGLVLGGL